MFAASKSGSADAKDANFKNVTMLLHGNGTNGAQNNTFVDSSTNNFTITRNGNTTQGTFTPYGSNWSNYFGGSSDYLTMPDNANYVISGDFTAEAWIFPTSFAGTNGNIVLAQWPGVTATNQSFQFYVNSTGKVGLAYGISVVNANVVGTSLSCTLNTWNHIAVTRSGSTVRFFVNGSVDSTTATVAGSFNDSTGVMSVGRINASDSGYFSGYISNCRLVTGTALYTAAFTPTTSPLTAISGTQVLVCQANRFADASSNNATITVGGSPSVQRFSPFSPTSAYSTSVIGGSGYFDGSGDTLNTASNAAFGFGSGAWTFEAWVYPITSQTDNWIIATNDAGKLRMRVGASGYLSFYTDTGSISLNSTTVVTVNAWSHVAICYDGTTLSLFQNGTRTATSTVSISNGSANSCYIGSNTVGGGYWNGYISDARVVKGSAVYSGATYTVPTAPLTSITNTSFLVSYTNAGILDNAMMNDLETVGNAQISTSVKKYGTGSMYFDGTGDWLNVPHNENLNMRTGDFTVECWVNRTATTSSPNSADVFYAKGTNLSCAINISTGKFQADHYGVVALLTSTTAVSNGTWYHFAVTRSGTTLRLFVNGSLEASMTYSADFSSTTNLYVGADPSNTNQRFYGYLDDLRVTKGFARYTASFTAPTAPFPDKG